MKITEMPTALLMGNTVQLIATETKKGFDVWGKIYLPNFDCRDPYTWLVLDHEQLNKKQVAALYLKLSRTCLHDLTYRPPMMNDKRQSFQQMPKVGAELPLWPDDMTAIKFETIK